MTIQYLLNGFIQNKRLLSVEEEKLILKNRAIWRTITDPKEQNSFEDSNKCWSRQGEIWNISPFHVAIKDRKEGDICSVVTNVEHPKDFQIRILTI